MDTSARRLAVHVEDHPIEYAKFSGKIPKGEYGAGTVKIWDKGTYRNLLDEKPRPRSVASSIKDGHVEIALDGKKLKGSFALIRMKPQGRRDNWLLIKMKDREKNKSPQRNSIPKRLSTRNADERSVQTTNLDKVLFPESGVTKGDLLDYYRRISDRLIPYLQDRPITLERLPDGIQKGAPHFWQKNTPDYYPSWISRVRIESGDGETVEYALVNNLETLEFLVNQGTITFHPWFSRVVDLDRPDFVVFDLDPGESPFDDVVMIAREIHRILKKDKLEAFVKTSGKTGIHVLTPWTNSGNFEAARDWAFERAYEVVSALPEIATVERSKAKRGGRVYVDVMQNARGHHAVAPYVVRATPSATISTPLRWSELTPRLDPARFNVGTIFRRLGRLKHDPFDRFLKLLK